MTPEQLAAARATHWRQDAQPLLTLEDATAWLERVQLALYLPRKSHVLAPAPSFVEAVLGQGSATPGPDALQQAHALLVRMVVEGTAVPLNLFGTPGEQPDFLIATRALPHLAALQADRNWKKPPARTGPGKVSPLAIEIWKVLEREGALTAIEIREQLGHELTEAATIRGLSELWQNLRVAPLPAEDGEGAQWEILSITHKKEMAAGGTMSQSAALSMLVSNYLQSVITGTAEDIEAFLSPVASRSRLRDVIRGLTATRQLKSLSMDAQTFFFIEGTLPEMPEVAASSAEGTEARPAFMGRSAYRERMLNKGKDEEETAGEGAAQGNTEDAPRRTPFRPASDRSSDRPAFKRPFSDRSAPARSASSGPTGPRRSFGAGAPRSSGSARPSFRDRSTSTGRPPFRRDAGAEGRSDRPARPSYGGSNSDRPRPTRPYPDRSSSGRSSADRPSADRSSADRRSGDRPSSDRAGSGRPFSPRAGAGRPSSGGRPGFDRKPGGPGEGRPFTARPTSSRPASSRPFTPRSAGDRPSFKPRSSFGQDSARPSRPRPDGDRPRSSEGRPFKPREGGRPFESRPFDPKNSSRAGFMSRAGGRTGRPAGDRPRPDRAPGDRPSSGRPRPARADGDRPFTPRPRTGSSESRSDSRPPRRFDGKPAFKGRDGAPRSDSRPPRREGSSSGYPSNPNRPSRAPRAEGSFVKRDGASGRPSSTGRPSSGGRPPARGGKPGFGPRAGGPGSPGRNPGGTGRPGGPRVGGGARPGGARTGGARPGGRPTGPSRPGGMKPPTRKPRPEKDSE